MVVVTAISVGLAAYSAGATFLASVAAGFGTLGVFGSFLVQAALGFALNALAPKPKLAGANRGYQVNTRGSALDHQIVYGEVRIGGVIIFEESVEGSVDDPDVDNQFLLRVYAHAGHEVEGYQDVYIDGKKVTEWRRADNDVVVSGPSAVANGVGLVPYTVCDVRSDGSVIPEAEVTGSCSNRYGLNSEGARVNNMTLRFYDGTQTTADATLVSDSNSWNAGCVLNDIAYMTATFGFDAEVYPNGVPEITCTIKGKKCFDPRTGTTIYSQNPAICIRDYLTSGYGLAEASANIDDNLVIAAANVCDQDVEAGIDRYTCKGAFVTSVSPDNILADLLTSMGGLLWYSQGKWRMKPAYWTPPSLTLTEDDLRSNISVKTRHSRRDNFNVVRGTFRGDSTNWQVTDYPEVPVSGSNPFLAIDNGQESVIDLDLPFTDNPFIARRIARIFLERNRQQLTISASFGLRAFGLQIGDNVNLTLERFGWVEKTFEVNSWTFGLTEGNDLQVQMTLREISENVFDEVDDGSVFELDNTKLADPFLTETPTNLTAIDSGFVNTDGTFVNSIAVSWNAVKDNLVDYYVLEWKRSTATQYNSIDLTTKNYEIPSVEDGVQYNIRVKSMNAVGVSSDYASITFTPGYDTTAPGLPTNISAVGGFEYITVSWTNPPDTDLKSVEVYENSLNTTAGATLVGTSGGTEFVRTNLGISETKYYFLKSVDYSGNKSAFTAGVVGTSAFIDDADFENGIRTLFEDQGLYPIEDVDTLPASGTLNRKAFNRADGKLYEWNGAAWVLVIAAVEAPDIDGQLTDAQIANLAAVKLTGQITETQISNDSISTPKLQAGSISTAKIAANAITADKIAAGSITSNEIAANTITANDIATGTITASEISGNTITGNKIVANTITGGLLATSGIITNSAQINNALITNAKIGNLAVDSAKIANAAITTAKIGDLQVDTIKIKDQAVSNSGADSGGLTTVTAYTNIASVTLSTGGGQTIINVEGEFVFGGVGGEGSSYDGAWRILVNGVTLVSDIIGGVDGGSAPFTGLALTTAASGTTTITLQCARSGFGNSTVQAKGTLVTTELKK